MEKVTDIELKSPEMQEIMTKPPAWLSRWGIVVILVLLGIGLLLSRYIRYPDLVVGSFTFVASEEKPGIESFHALVLVPANGPLKMKAGQEVILKADQFPFLEYGVLMGKVESLSFRPETNEYHVLVMMPPKLTTNTGRILLPLNGYRGIAEIKVNNLSLFQRLMRSMLPAGNSD